MTVGHWTEDVTQAPEAQRNGVLEGQSCEVRLTGLEDNCDCSEGVGKKPQNQLEGTGDMGCDENSSQRFAQMVEGQDKR